MATSISEKSGSDALPALETHKHVEISTQQIDLNHHVTYNEGAAKGDLSDGKIIWTVKSTVAAVSLCALYVGSQAPLYFVGGFLTFMGKELHATDKQSWLSVGNTLAIAVTAPFVGYLQDVLGRRNITLSGSLLLMIGCVLVATAHGFSQAVTGMVVAGVGAGIGELTALAGVAEIVPVRKRGWYISILTAAVLPLTPSLLYAQLLATYHTWRWGLWISLMLNSIAGMGILFSYFPGKRQLGLSRMQVLKQIDYFGAFISIVGLTLFLVALQAGGYSHKWQSAYVLGNLVIGVGLLVAFGIWEWKGAAHPLIPKEIFAGQRIVAAAFCVTFVSGMNFYSFINFSPLIFFNLFGQGPVIIGLKGFASALGITIGAVLVNSLLSVLRGHNRELLLTSTIVMTTFIGSCAAINPDRSPMSIGLTTLAGFGIGGVLVPAATVAITVTPDAFIATTVALALSLRFIGGAIGFSIYYNIFINKLTPKLPLYIGEYAVRAGLPLESVKAFVITYLEASTKISEVPGVTPAILQAASLGTRWAYSDSLSYVWYTSIAFGLLAIVACLFLGDMKRFMTNRIAIDLNHTY